MSLLQDRGESGVRACATHEQRRRRRLECPVKREREEARGLVRGDAKWGNAAAGALKSMTIESGREGERERESDERDAPVEGGPKWTER